MTRTIDANLNRAREALRVAEDVARFVLDDPALSMTAKHLRHDLQIAARSFGASELAESRDSLGDVGAAIFTSTEYQRSGVVDIATAAALRVTEALRVLEEFSKVVDVASAKAFQELRYRAYEFGRALGLRLRSRSAFAGVRLYVLLTESICRGDWWETAQAALRGGASVIQLREKSLSDRELLRRARRLAPLCREFRAQFIVNDRPDIAVLSGADGVHIGQDDLTIRDVRQIVGAQAVVGISTHDVGQVQAAQSDAPNYLAVGPMFPSRTKPQVAAPGLGLAADAARMTSIPLVAIGGIDHSNICQVIKAGVGAVCVCSVVLSAADPEEHVRRLVDAFPTAPHDARNEPRAV